MSVFKPLCVAVLAAMVSTAAIGVPYVYPAKGQSHERQMKDESACHRWAVGQTGFDPAAPAAAPASAAPAPGSGVRGAARGAAAGSVIGAIGGNNVGKAAGIGAAAGAVHGRMKSRRNTQAAQQQQAASAQAAYARAWAVCLEGRGYAVK